MPSKGDADALAKKKLGRPPKVRPHVSALDDAQERDPPIRPKFMPIPAFCRYSGIGRSSI
jgi:hypothetical protein